MVNSDTVAGRAAAADDALRSVLHERLFVLPVPELDQLLVEVVEVAWRVSELAARIDTALGERSTNDRLRLDGHGRQHFNDATEAITVARAALSGARLAADETARSLDAARQVTATIGLAFDDPSGGGGR